MIDFWTEMMVVAEEVMEIIELTAKEAVQALTMWDALEGTGIVAEIPKSSRMARPKKEKQAMVLICVSP